MLSRPQKEVFSHDARFKVLISGRRFGKTHLAVDLCAYHARRSGRKVWYIAPTYRMAREIAWSHLKDKLERKRWLRKAHETRLEAELVNGSKIQLRGADNPNSLRGVGLDFVVLDEFADIKKEAWSEALRPTLSDTGGLALFCGTPKGFNWAYELYQKGQRNDDGQWASWQFTTLDGGFVPPDEIEAAKRDLDEKTFRQEYLATFETYAGVVYYNFSRFENHTDRELGDFSHKVLHIGMDFNINPMTAIVMQIEDDKVYAVDEVVIYGSNTYEMRDEIESRYEGFYKVVYPDPTCISGGTSAHAGVTDLKILQRGGFKIRMRSAPPRIRDRVNAVNSKLKNANGERALFVNTKKCKHLTDALEKQIYKEGTGQPDKTQGFDHPNDALGYPIEFLYPVADKRMRVTEV